MSGQKPPQSVETFDEIGPGAHTTPEPRHRAQRVAVRVQGRNGQSAPEPVVDVEVELFLGVGQHTRTPEVIDRHEDPHLHTHTSDIIRVHPEETRHPRDIPAPGPNATHADAQVMLGATQATALEATRRGHGPAGVAVDEAVSVSSGLAQAVGKVSGGAIVAVAMEGIRVGASL